MLLPFKVFPYSIFSYVIGQISNPQMSSLSDHFALNTTLRNFCFLALHTEDTHTEKTDGHTITHFFLDILAFCAYSHRKHHSRLHFMASSHLKLGISGRSRYNTLTSPALTYLLFGTTRTPKTLTVYNHIIFFSPFFSQQQCASELLHVFRSVQHTGLGSGAFCCSTYVTSCGVAKSTNKKSGTTKQCYL